MYQVVERRCAGPLGSELLVLDTRVRRGGLCDLGLQTGKWESVEKKNGERSNVLS